MSLERLAGQIQRCRKCRLWKMRENAVPGEGNPKARLFFVGEAPGREEDKRGRPFVGAAGKILDESLERAGLKRKGIFITSVLKCRPPVNRNPRKDEIEKCRSYLASQIEEVDPDVILALGRFGHKALSGKSMKVSEARLTTGEYAGRVLAATYHPAAVLYNRRLQRHLTSDLKRAWKLAKSEDVRIISGPTRRGKKTVRLQSAGGAIFRKGRILLIRKRSEKLWCLPKGQLEEGENIEQAARREMKEETGLRNLRIEQRLCDVEYSYFWPQDNINYQKEAAYFLTRAPGKQKPRLENRFDACKWCTERDAQELLHHDNDVHVVKEAFKATQK